VKITNVECFVLLAPDYRVDTCSSFQDDVVAKIHLGISLDEAAPAEFRVPRTRVAGAVTSKGLYQGEGVATTWALESEHGEEDAPGG
jgi:hypothetical protein